MCPSGNVKVFRAGWIGAAGVAGATALGVAGAAALGVAVPVGAARAVGEDVAAALRPGAALCAVALSYCWGPQAERTRLMLRPATVTAL